MHGYAFDVVEEPLRLFVVVRCPPVPDMIEMDRKLGSVDRPSVAEILSGSDDFSTRVSWLPSFFAQDGF